MPNISFLVLPPGVQTGAAMEKSLEAAEHDYFRVEIRDDTGTLLAVVVRTPADVFRTIKTSNAKVFYLCGTDKERVPAEDMFARFGERVVLLSIA